MELMDYIGLEIDEALEDIDRIVRIKKEVENEN